MDHTPEISVIVPVYKVERYLAQCIDSILAQTFTDFELLLIDDGSPDRSGEICDEYARKDSRVRVFHQENAGVSMARNKGLDEAVGKYITYVDSDDYIKSSYLKNLYSALPSDNNFRGLVIGGFDKIFSNGKVRQFHVPELEYCSDEKSKVVTDLMNQNIGYIASKLYDNRLIKQYNLRFVTDISCLEDMLFMLEYVLCADFIYIRDFADYVYRVGCSTEVLSVRIRDFQAEYAAFSNFLKRVYAYQRMYGLEDDALINSWRSLTVFFHKIILAVYNPENGYSRKVRLSSLQKVLTENEQWIRKHFLPQYLADKVAKFLLCHVGVWAFDGWMCFLWSVGFKKMFGAK